MRLAILLLATASLWAADAPRLTFSKSFPGSMPPFFSITVERSGAASYNESTDPDNAEKLQIEAPVVEEIFGLAQKLDRFQKPLESGLKVANMGQKTFRWEEGSQKSEATFNYSASEDAKLLTDYFERIADSTRIMLELKRSIRHDRLGVNAAVLRIQTLWNNKRLVGTPQILPLLEEVAGNEVYIHMARERAAQIVDAIRANAAK